MAAGVSIRAEYVSWITCLCLLISGIAGFKDVTYNVEKSADEFGEINFDVHAEIKSSHDRLRRQAVEAANDSSTVASSTDIPSTLPDVTKTPSKNISSATTTTSTTSPTTTTTTSTSAPSTTTKSATASATPLSTTAFPPYRNETAIEEELNHTYYDSTTIRGPQASAYWVDLNDPSYQKKTHGTLSNSHRTAATVELRFKFIFYGHEVAKVTIATGGFLYMSDFLHQWLTATQYIAPLMANFDTQLGNNSQIHYADNGTAFIVQWENVHLQDNPEYGQFNFQAILLSNGNVIFVYKEVPVSVSQITSAAHPVKVGLSDAYYYDSQISTDVRRRTIYEYHRVNISFSKIASDTVIIIKPKPTCVQIHSCEECTAVKIGFDCKWCPAVRRCSDGLDRKRQEWHKRGCTSRFVGDYGMCASAEHWRSGPGARKASVKPVAVIIPVVIILVVLLGVFWFIYAYRNPQSQSGMWLIEHRPSNLKAKLNNVRFWKRNGTGGEKYEVSMQPEGESVA